MSEHAKLSPSGAHRWMRCPASLLLEQQFPDKGSVYADEGTKAHDLAARILEGQTVFGADENIPEEMFEHVMDYVKLVGEYATDGTLLVEQRVQFSEFIGVPDSFGTSDAVILHPNTLTIIDLKYGMGVKVDAIENEQLMLYALGCLYEFGWFGEFQEVRMVIHMPRLNHVSEYVIPTTQLLEFAEKAREAAAVALTDNAPFNPGEKQCRFCKAKASCEALKQEVAITVSAASAEDFDNITPVVPEEPDVLALVMSKVDMIEKWCKAVRAEVERRLVAGEPVPGYMLVEGRLGPRKWSDEDAVVEACKRAGLEEENIFERSLISPTKAEKLLKKDKALWSELQTLTTRSPGTPSVAPATDKRPAITGAATAEDFG